MRNLIKSLAIIGVLANVTSTQASYSITVPANGKFFAAYHFSAQSVSQIFPLGSVPIGTQLQVWNNSSQSYDTIDFDDFEGTWTDPNYVFNPGTAFFIVNNTGSAETFTISGTEISGSASVSLVAGNWNGYGSVKLPAAHLECVCQGYTGMNFPAEDGDEMHWWNPSTQSWSVYTRETTSGGHHTWSGTCNGGVIALGYNSIYENQPGWGAFFTTSTSKTWTYGGPVSCD